MNTPRTIKMKLNVDTKDAERRLDKFQKKLEKTFGVLLRYQKISRRSLFINASKVGKVYSLSLIFKGKKTEAS